MKRNLSSTQGAAVSGCRVAKKLSVQAPGARMLHRQFGEALVCVRHRLNTEASVRFVTVELLVDARPVEPKPQPMVTIQLERQERALQRLVHAAGGKWDPKTQRWSLPKRLVTLLRLQARVTPR